MIYASAAGFASILPQVFHPRPSQWALEAVPEQCAEGLGQLREELLGRVARHIGTAGTDAPDPQVWLASWDDRHLALERRCNTAPEQRAHAQLGRLRHHTGTLLSKFDRQEGRMARDIDRRIRALAEGSGETPR